MFVLMGTIFLQAVASYVVVVSKVVWHVRHLQHVQIVNKIISFLQVFVKFVLHLIVLFAPSLTQQLARFVMGVSCYLLALV